MIVCSEHFVSTLYYMQEKGIPVIGVQNLISVEELKEKMCNYSKSAICKMPKIQNG